jgi:hypothetical protein
MQSGIFNLPEAKPLECASLLAPSFERLSQGGSKLPQSKAFGAAGCRKLMSSDANATGSANLENQCSFVFPVASFVVRPFEFL